MCEVHDIAGAACSESERYERPLRWQEKVSTEHQVQAQGSRSECPLTVRAGREVGLSMNHSQRNLALCIMHGEY